MGFRDFTTAVRPKAGETGQHIVVMREHHFDDSTTKMLRENRELTRGATVSLELPYVAFNPILTAHRNKTISNEELIEFFTAYAKYEEENLDDSMRKAFTKQGITHEQRLGTFMEKAYMTIALHNRQPPVPVVAHDTRGNPYLHHRSRGIDKSFPDYMKDSLLLSRRMSQRFPESIKHVAFILASQKDGIPTDVTSATIASEMIGKNGLGFAVVGALHANGIPRDKSKVEGIFDETLEKQGAKVTDAMIVAHPEWLEIMRKSEQIALFEHSAHALRHKLGTEADKPKPLSHDRLDYLYFFTQGQLYSGADIQRNGYYNPVIPEGQPRHPKASYQLYGKSAEDAWGNILKNEQGKAFIEAVERFIKSQPKSSDLKAALDTMSSEYGPGKFLSPGETALSKLPNAKPDKGTGEQR